MDAAQFRLPVRLKIADGDIKEIYSAEEALEVLFGWPQQRGPVYDDACAECLAASTITPESTDEARRAFTAFARLSGILERNPFIGPETDDVKAVAARH